jgi:hypothetical protein
MAFAQSEKASMQSYNGNHQSKWAIEVTYKQHVWHKGFY